jgi:hypothetical protein
MAARWKVDGARGVWLVRGDARAAAGLHAEALGGEAAAAQMDGWFPEGWGREGLGTLTAICHALEGSFPEGESPGAGWLKGTLRRALRDGRVTAVRVGFGAPASSVSPEEPATLRASARFEETTWVELVVVDDTTNKPISGVRLSVKLPDGSRRVQGTDDEGVVRIDPVERGLCDAACPSSHRWLGTTLGFVAVGGVSLPGDAREQGTARDGLGIMNVIAHKVRTGETLDGLARANDLTWQDLARFNFDTDDPKEISGFLRARVGCTRRTKDRNNYLFSDSDDPGIVFIPRPWEERGLSTGRTHVIRVRRFVKTFRLFVFSC